MNLKAGKYELSFDWAARDGKRLDTSQVIVKFNNVVLANLVPTDYFVHRYSVVVDGNDGINTVEFNGAGAADGYGASICNVMVRPA